MNKFIHYLELDLSLEIFVFKKENKEFKSTVKIDNEEVKEIKIKKENVLFTSFDENENSFIIKLYTSNNHTITLIFSLIDNSLKDDFTKFKEYMKSLLP